MSRKKRNKRTQRQPQSTKPKQTIKKSLSEDEKINIEIKNEETQKAMIRQQTKFEYEKQKAIDDAENEKLIAIEKKEKERNDFKDIHWMSQNLYNQMNLYINKKKKFEGDLLAYQQKLEKNKKDIESIIPDNIFKNIAFLPSFLTAIITFVLSWVMREQFWYLSGIAIITLIFLF